MGAEEQSPPFGGHTTRRKRKKKCLPKVFAVYISLSLDNGGFGEHFFLKRFTTFCNKKNGVFSWGVRGGVRGVKNSQENIKKSEPVGKSATNLRAR